MGYNTILLRYGEIFLKGSNRGLFIKKLIDNIKKITGIKWVERVQGRLIVDFFAEHSKLRRVFGLNSYSPALKVGKNLEEINQAALKLLEGKKGTFKVVSRRSDKSFPIKSPDLNVEVGKYIEANSHLEFSFSDPAINLGIEINQDGAYLFLETVQCFGGLPTGVEGEVYLLLQDEASFLAGLMFMKRGCNIIPVGKGDFSLLQQYSPQKLVMEEKVIDSSIPLVVGQNFDNYQKIEGGNLVFRPLIGFSEEEVEENLAKFKV